MLDAIKELQEQQLRTNKATSCLAGADSDKESNKSLEF